MCVKILVVWILSFVDLVFLVPFRRLAEIHNVGCKYGMLYYNFKKLFTKVESNIQIKNNFLNFTSPNTQMNLNIST